MNGPTYCARRNGGYPPLSTGFRSLAPLTSGDGSTSAGRIGMPRVQPGCKQRQHLFVAHHDSALARLTARSVQPVKAQLWVALSRSCGSRARLPEGYNVENSTRRICLAPSVTWIPESLTLMESAVNEMLTGSTSWSLPGSTVTFVMTGAPLNV